jgi:Trm5-related predicted tRNA methylase
MVARKLLTATAVGLTVGLLAQHATGAEALVVVQKAPLVTKFVVDTQLFRTEIDGYVRELNQQMRTTLNEDLRRQLAPKTVLASNELRTRS